MTGSPRISPPMSSFLFSFAPLIIARDQFPSSCRRIPLSEEIQQLSDHEPAGTFRGRMPMPLRKTTPGVIDYAGFFPVHQTCSRGVEMDIVDHGPEIIAPNTTPLPGVLHEDRAVAPSNKCPRPRSFDGIAAGGMEKVIRSNFGCLFPPLLLILILS